MKKTALATVAVLATLGGPTIAFAEDAPAASPITYNIGVVSDYRYRGISQTKLKPALQGGVDYAQGPFYAGTWLSTIGWVKDAMVATNRANAGNEGYVPVDEKGSPVEWDLYAGT